VAICWTRNGGAWFVAILDAAVVQVIALTADGKVASGPTNLQATVGADHESSALQFDVVPSPDGGLFMAWGHWSGDDDSSPLEIAHLDASGAIVERGAAALPDAFQMLEIHIVRRTDAYLMFLRVDHLIHKKPPESDALSADALDVITISDASAGGN
jgi:hypothetical protein